IGTSFAATMPATTGTGGSSIRPAPGPFLSALAVRPQASHTTPPTIKRHSTMIPAIFPPEDFGFGASLRVGGGVAFADWSAGGIVRLFVFSSIVGISSNALRAVGCGAEFLAQVVAPLAFQLLVVVLVCRTCTRAWLRSI